MNNYSIKYLYYNKDILFIRNVATVVVETVVEISIISMKYH
ncbi:MAG: hypothetical protein ABIP40_13060 [Bacteroidia bacterium]